MIIEDKNIDGGKGFETSCRISGWKAHKRPAQLLKKIRGQRTYDNIAKIQRIG